MQTVLLKAHTYMHVSPSLYKFTMYLMQQGTCIITNLIRHRNDQSFTVLKHKKKNFEKKIFFVKKMSSFPTHPPKETASPPTHPEKHFVKGYVFNVLAVHTCVIHLSPVSYQLNLQFNLFLLK